jgi:peptidyl-prolyl cis-trans isomerase B (cyclophilin B)
MAVREQERDTAGSQFFITIERQPALDGRFTQLAVVTEGMEVVERLQPGDLIRNIYVDPGVRTKRPR